MSVTATAAPATAGTVVQSPMFGPRVTLADRLRSFDHQTDGASALCSSRCPRQSHTHTEFVAVPRPLHEAVRDVLHWQRAFVLGFPLPATPIDEDGHRLTAEETRFYFGRDCLSDTNPNTAPWTVEV
ncbi:hypothetical protein [Isoptericola sp. NPDC058082]|uniref:hypothetical protein n=1 Tax=Isoptericola sp. NPDC058082 TaxID=3346331 RepID=UPI0036EF3F85